MPCYLYLGIKYFVAPREFYSVGKGPKWLNGYVLESGGKAHTAHTDYFSLCAFNLFNKRVSQFELNY